MNNPQKISDYRVLGYTQDDKKELADRIVKPTKTKKALASILTFNTKLK